MKQEKQFVISETVLQATLNFLSDCRSNRTVAETVTLIDALRNSKEASSEPLPQIIQEALGN